VARAASCDEQPACFEETRRKRITRNEDATRNNTVGAAGFVLDVVPGE